MVKILFDEKFKRSLEKLNNVLKERIWKQIKKIMDSPKVGKPMMYGRTGTRELYIKPFRLSYRYIEEKDIVEILEIYHKKNQ